MRSSYLYRLGRRHAIFPMFPISWAQRSIHMLPDNILLLTIFIGRCHRIRRTDMKRITLATAVILTCTVVGWSQDYYEASGQTQVFTFKAGAKSGPAAIHRASVQHAMVNNGIKFMTTRGRILITLPTSQQGSAKILLFNIAGRQIYRQRGYSGTSLHIETQAFASGIYTAIVRVDGKNYSRRFAVSR
jgi:hypothetical protein